MTAPTLREAVWRRDTAQAAGEVEKAAHYHRMAVALREIERAAADLHRAQTRLQSIQNEDS